MLSNSGTRFAVDRIRFVYTLTHRRSRRWPFGGCSRCGKHSRGSNRQDELVRFREQLTRSTNVLALQISSTAGERFTIYTFLPLFSCQCSLKTLFRAANVFQDEQTVRLNCWCLGPGSPTRPFAGYTSPYPIPTPEKKV